MTALCVTMAALCVTMAALCVTMARGAVSMIRQAVHRVEGEAWSLHRTFNQLLDIICRRLPSDPPCFNAIVMALVKSHSSSLCASTLSHGPTVV